jgi:hypothetical protein
MPRTRQRLAGLARSTLWELAIEGKIKTVCVHKKGCNRGVRLVHLPSLLAYLETLAIEQQPRPGNATRSQTVCFAPSDASAL